ncbi:serine/threonine protein kinase, partial [Streptomyces sp. SID7499]|nr:serine/threonine protein kinase [Streptomyces sp. SID7499]
MFSLRPDSASGQTLLDEETVQGKKVVDGFSYKDGRGTLLGNEGLLKDQRLLDLDRVDWDALPRLLRIARTELGVLNPDPEKTQVNFDWYEGQGAIVIHINGEYRTS